MLHEIQPFDFVRHQSVVFTVLVNCHLLAYKKGVTKGKMRGLHPFVLFCIKWAKQIESSAIEP